MRVFEHIIANDIIKGITGLQTVHDERNNTVQHSFSVIVHNQIPIYIASDPFDAGNKELRDQWLMEYQLIKDAVAKLLGEKSPQHASHNSIVDDTVYDIKGGLDKILSKLTPRPEDQGYINSTIERVHISLKKLYDLATK